MIVTIEKIERRTKKIIMVRFKGIPNFIVGFPLGVLEEYGIKDLHVGDKLEVKGRQDAKAGVKWGLSDLTSIKIIK